MYPHTSYDEQNGLAYVALSGKEIVKSIESDDELFVLDLDQNGGIVGIEVLSVPRLQEHYTAFSRSRQEKLSPEMIPACLLPFVYLIKNRADAAHR